MRSWFALVILGILLGAMPAHAVAPRHTGKADRLDMVPIQAGAPLKPIRKEHFVADVCEAISREARKRSIPEAFFARLIWRESLFDPNAVSPKGAEGIAQFMPGTAKLRGLADPFMPHLALEASAHFLSDLKLQHGNLGLAAAAYNAGSGAVDGWQRGKRSLPYETQDYVIFITGRPAEDWADRNASHPQAPLGAEPDFAKSCQKLVLRQLNPTPPTERGDWKPWGVVLARGFVESRVLKSFAQLRGRYPSVLGEAKPMVMRKRNPGMGRRRLATAMVGADSRAEAQSLCDKLRRLGAVCVVSRN